MATDAATYERRLRKHGAWHKTFTRPGTVRRVRHFVEKTDWDEIILAQEEWIDRMCIGVIIIAAIYFVPPLLTILFMG